MGVNLTALSEEIENVEKKKFNSQDYLKDFVRFPEEGYVVVRLLSPASEANPFYLGIKRHKINKKNLQCPKVFDGGYWKGKCPICEYASSLWQQSKSPELNPKQVKELRDIYSAIKGRPRYFFNCVVRSEEGVNNSDNVVDDTPKMLSANQELKDFIIRSMIGDKKINKKGFGDVTHPVTGRDLNIVVIKNAGGFPDFGKSEFLDQSPLSTKQAKIDKWMNSLHDLNARRKAPSLDELEKEVLIFRGLESEPASEPVKTAVVNEEAALKSVMKQTQSHMDVDMDLALDADDILKDLDVDI